MILRIPLRLSLSRVGIRQSQVRAISTETPPEKPETTAKPSEPKKYYHVSRLKPGEGDPKLAQAILDLAQGYGAVQVPKDTVGLHLDFAKAQYGGHMGARKFAQLNLPRMKFYNPHLDIKVFRRPWAGQKMQYTYPCSATILKANGTVETIDMRGKRSMAIYQEIMKALRAVDISEKFEVAKKQGEVMAKPYLKWV